METNPTAQAAQAAQAAANPPTNQPVVNPQPTFALTPSKAIQGIIDYSTKFGATIWNNNTKPLSEKYNLDPVHVLRSIFCSQKDEIFGCRACFRRAGFVHRVKCTLFKKYVHTCTSF